MGCTFHQNCGGCTGRDLSLDLYRLQKEQSVKSMLEKTLGDLSSCWEIPVFLPDGLRRRAAFTFEMSKNKLILGFNENKSHAIEDIENCMMLHPKINGYLSDFKSFLEQFCNVSYQKKGKGKKFTYEKISKGDFLVTLVDNGLDLVLEAASELSLEHRMIISDFVGSNPDIIRFSFRKNHETRAETVIEKIKSYVLMNNYKVFIAAGDFLQPSKEGEEALSNIVLRYIGQNAKAIADLFCGIGTFSYRFANKQGVKISSFDISRPLLDEFQRCVNSQMITNIQIEEKNLFEYPLTSKELEKFDTVVIDPPRAGAKAQIRELCGLIKPVQLIYVSCSPKSFVFDALILKQNNFHLKKITLVDQFVYSAHSELVSLWTNEK